MLKAEISNPLVINSYIFVNKKKKHVLKEVKSATAVSP